MADNKEITTLHPYLNRNKNRYPNVKDENIPDTIQRKLTAGQGINISPENVISATGGDSYTRDETDALLDTKADKVALENVNKVVPTDIAVKNGKLGLEHDTTWLTNQNAITLGDGLSYDEATKTLKAEGSGATLPAGSSSDPFNLNMNQIEIYGSTSGASILHINNETSDSFNIQILTRSTDERLLSLRAFNPSKDKEVYLTMYRSESKSTIYHYLTPPNDNKYTYHILEIAKDTIDSLADGDYSLSINVKNKKFYCVATQGDSALKKTYNHYIVINDTTTANAIYLLIPSTNNLKCNSLTDLNTLLGTAQRFIQASGVVTNNASKLPIVALNWQGSIATSKILTMSSEETTTKFTNVVDVVEPA